MLRQDSSGFYRRGRIRLQHFQKSVTQAWNAGDKARPCPPSNLTAVTAATLDLEAEDWMGAAPP